MKAPTMLHLIVLVDAVEMMAKRLAQSDAVLSENDERLINAAMHAAKETRENG